MNYGGNVETEVIEEFVQNCKSAEMLLIGIGSELHPKVFPDKQKLLEMLQFFYAILEKKNYFIITSMRQNIFSESAFSKKRIVNPMMLADGEETEAKQWELYNKWLSATLNHKLMILELGESFQNPELFRWPFEKIVSVHEKAMLYRIHGTFYQLPENIGGRAKGICCNALTFLEAVRRRYEDL